MKYLLLMLVACAVLLVGGTSVLADGGGGSSGGGEMSIDQSMEALGEMGPERNTCDNDYGGPTVGIGGGGGGGGGGSARPSCTLSPANATVPHSGGWVTFNWTTRNAIDVRVQANSIPRKGVGLNGSDTAFFSNSDIVTMTVTARGGARSTCTSRIQKAAAPQPPRCTMLTADPAFIPSTGGNVTFGWNVTGETTSVRATSPSIGNASIPKNGRDTVFINGTETVTITATGPGGSDSCSANIQAQAPARPTCSLSASPRIVGPGERVTLSYTSDSEDGSVFIMPPGRINPPLRPYSGTETVSPTVTTQYTLTTCNGSFNCAYCYETVTIEQSQQPTCTLNASPTSVSSGSSATLNWSTTNASFVSISNVGSVNTSGSRSVTPAGTTTYQLTATGPGGTRTCSRTVTVNQPAQAGPTCSFLANPTSVSPGGGTTLSWSTVGASAVSISGIGNVPLGSTRWVIPTTSTTYQLTATGPGGTTYCQAPVSVTAPQTGPVPTCSFSANPGTIPPGSSAALNWSTSGATSVSIAPNIGSVATNGFQNVTPGNSTNYTLTASGPGGTTYCQTSVTVQGGAPPVDPPPAVNPGGGGGGGNGGGAAGAPPTATLEVRNLTQNSSWTEENIAIDPGDEIAVRWNSTNADSCSGSNFSTGSATSGTDEDVVEPMPTLTRTYTVTCAKSGHSPATDSLIVTNIAVPPELMVDRTLARIDEDIEFTWNLNGNPPEMCTLTGPNLNLGSLAGLSSHTLTMTLGVQTFTISCPGGEDEVTVNVIPIVFES